MISIITPVYNAEKYLEQTVECILSQSYTDIELILVNDGSVDSSGELCNALAKKDARIKVVHKKNGGVASARNAGLDAASGEYIGWVDSDDLVHPDMYSIMMKAAIEYNADIVQCSHTRNKDEMKACNTSVLESLQVLDNVGGLKRMYTSHYTNSLSLWSKIYRREVFDGVRFTVGTAFEDDEIVPVLIERAARIVYFELPLYCYVKREGSIITAPKVENIMALSRHIEGRMLRFECIDEELYMLSLKHFFHYTKIKVCERQFVGTLVQKQAVSLLKKHRKRVWKIANKYDKIAIAMIYMGLLNCVVKCDFEPVQILIGKIKKHK